MEHVKIKIDGKSYKIEGNSLTGKQLKELASIPFDKSLSLEIPNEPDTEIINEQNYELHGVMKFFSELYKPQVIVKVDGKEYKINRECDGKEIRDAVGIGADSKIIKEVKDAQDLKIEDNVRYEIDEDDIFFVVPAGINNGGM